MKLSDMRTFDDVMAERNRQLARILTDLDRCVHGRHRGDVCTACGDGISDGNPHLQPGQIIGYNTMGDPYTAPSMPFTTSDPEAWKADQ